jgi:hypothetical protein
MKFVPSLDDSALAAFAGFVTAVVAGTTALSSGYSVLRHEKDTSVSAELDTHIIMPAPMTLNKTGSLAYLRSTDSEDTGDAGDTNSSPVSLCDHVEASGDGMDTMNEELDVILNELKTRKDQRRK